MKAHKNSVASMPLYISRAQAAALLSCDVQSLDKAIRKGRLPVSRLGRKVLIKQEELLRLLDAGELQ